MTSIKQELLRKLPSVGKLLEGQEVARWLESHPRELVARCLRVALDELRRQIQEDAAGRCGPMHVTDQFVLERAAAALAAAVTPHLRAAINATGVILHTGLGRAVLPESVVDSMLADMKGYVNLAVDAETGQRSERDQRVEYVLTELTGAEAATVVNNNAAATLLVLAALAAGREVIVSRGQLIEIGGAFRLPDVMTQSGAKLVEVGTTNRTHRRDYERAITDATAMIMRVHPSNFRVVGFTAEVDVAELAEVAHARGLVMLDDLGAGALVDLRQFGLPHEPTVGESLAAGADVAIFSADKLIGASQGGIIVGKQELIERIRKHPLARACRPDKICVMALERTLHLFRDPGRLAETHPLYRMISTSLEALDQRARRLVELTAAAAPSIKAEVVPSVGYLGSGSLPTQEMPSVAVRVVAENIKPDELARRLRVDPAAVFARIEDDAVILDMRTVMNGQVGEIAQAMGRILSVETPNDSGS